MVEPYIVPDAEPFQDQYIAAVDEAISEQMRAVLHHPEFQALEALWRSVHTLVSGLETGEELKLYLLDISKYELEEDIKMAQDQLEHSQLFKLLVENGTGTLGGEPWSVLIGDYSFTTDNEDLSLLASLGAISSQAGGPFIAAADASMLGCQSVVNTPDPRKWQYEDKEAEQNWLALRQSAVAAWIGLAHPRALLRQPYGKTNDVLDDFDFEEISSDREHESFLWGNPAFRCALLIAQAYQSRGWSMMPGDILDVQDLPAYTFEEDGEMTLMPCAEVYLTDHAADAMLDRGIMPLVSYLNRNAVHLVRFQSIAEPNSALAGPWA
jgi:type VI secretion system protein ImpC